MEKFARQGNTVEEHVPKKDISGTGEAENK